MSYGVYLEADFAGIDGIIVSLAVCVGVSVVGVLPCLKKKKKYNKMFCSNSNCDLTH